MLATIYAVMSHSVSPVAPTQVGGSTARAALTVTVAPADRHPMANTLLVTGSLVPWEDLAIGTEAAGLTVTRVLVDEGDKVAAGQMLAKLDDSVILAELKQKQAQIDRAKAVIGQQDAAIIDAEAAAHNAGNDAVRAHELIKSGNISVQTTEAREATATTARARVQSARMGRQADMADVELAEGIEAELQARLAQTEIRAPAAGIITKRLIRVGAVVNSSTDLFRIERDGILELDAQVSDRLLARVRPGQPVRLSVSSADGTPIIATVRAIAPVVDASSRNGVAHIRLPADTQLSAGMFVSGQLVLAETEQLTLPEGAVLPKDGGAVVFVLSDDGRVAERRIEAGLRSEGLIAIREGLGPEDRVVQTGAGFLTDGDQVRVVERTAK
ncbi:MAG: efflux RND transporter periplasmic adaptor subunit [Aliidongia sp.]